MPKVAIQLIIEEKNGFAVPEIIDLLKKQGFVFGSASELIDYAERQKTRTLIGRLVDQFGKRKYVATQEQIAFDFGYEHIYCPAELVRSDISNKEDKSLEWLRKHMIALVKRTPLLPQWAINEIVAVIDKVFEKMQNAA